jgi:hypothetical protein
VDLANITIIVSLPPPKLVQSVERNIGTYMILQEIHKRVCTDHCVDGETTQERYHISVE